MGANDLSQETALYEQRKVEFEKEHNLEWVVIHDDEIVGFYDDFQKAAEAAVERFGRGPYLIRQIGISRQPLPASVLYQPLYAHN